ncbi:hypothetical protein [Bacillus seohaeanensis]|uniref:Uncharacterized protein n=1 Tax=Bacillus seohaeanensis TaxID=284580 RepID=A0ABW5RTS5_9BACI
MNRRIKHMGSFVGGLSKLGKPKRPLAFTGGIKARVEASGNNRNIQSD